MFGEYKITDTLSDEVLIIAYSYNLHQPRLYSKVNAKNYPKIYDKKLSDIVGGSSAAPMYFSPKQIENELDPKDPEVLIDGSTIAANPSLYARIVA